MSEIRKFNSMSTQTETIFHNETNFDWYDILLLYNCKQLITYIGLTVKYYSVLTVISENTKHYTYADADSTDRS